MSIGFAFQHNVCLRMVFSTRSRNVVIVLVIVGLGVLAGPVTSSRGDRDFTFHDCLKECPGLHCNGSHYKDQAPHMEYLGWDCEEECKYKCMWNTVAIFQNHSLDIPQFYGKWPFVRVLGIQEPASVIASVLNLFVHAYGLYLFRQRVSSEAPLFFYWHLFTLVCLNGWVWSIVFHTRDKPWTEHMDYFSAFSMVAFSFLSIFVRLCETLVCVRVLGTALLVVSFYAYHVYYLAFVHFDYGYNMAANIGLGLLNAVFWLGWSLLNRKAHPYAWKCSLFIVLAMASILLEVNDFPPILWTLDAHATWHFTTAFITPIWYSFLIDDCDHLYHKLKVKII